MINHTGAFGHALFVCFLSLASLGQVPSPPLTSDQIVEKASPSVAVVLAARSPSDTTGAVGTAMVVREDGVLLTAWHVVRNAYAIQIRFKSGEIFDEVQLLGVDARRDMAAVKISASGLPVLPVADISDVKPGESVVTVSHPAALPWSASVGVISAYRLADEVPGAGSGYRLIQFTAAASPGSSGGVLLDTHGRALGLIVGSLGGGQNLNFAVPLNSVIGLAQAPATRTFANASSLSPPWQASATPTAPKSISPSQPSAVAKPEAPEKSDILSASKDRDFILRHFRTMFVDARKAQYFRSDQMKAALARNKDFAALDIRIVDDPKVADTVLEVGYTFAWEYPFELRHQNTSIVLLAGKGSGPFSGPAGAASVASQFVKIAKPWRTGAAQPSEQRSK